MPGEAGGWWLERGEWQKQELVANGPGHLRFILRKCISTSGAPLRLRNMQIL